MNRAIENLLKALGYFAGVPDGQPDRSALDAARKFRAEHDLPSSAITMDGLLLVRLGEEVLARLATQTAPPRDSTELRLATLRRLRDQGLIDEAEYQAKRKQILDSL